MKRLLTFLLLVCIGSSTTFAQEAEAGILTRAEITHRLIDATYHPNYFQSMSHRGRMSGYDEYPENSLSAIINTVSLGVSLIEVDLKKSSDGVVIVMHDDYLQRTTNFLDLVPGVGEGKDNYGKCSTYPWSLLNKLVLKRADFTYTTERIPTFLEVLRYVRDNTSALLELDITTVDVFEAAWNVVKDENAFDIVIFKTRDMGVDDFRNNYYYKLTQEQQNKLILFVIIDARIPDTMNYYVNWEQSRIPKGYEVSYKDNKSDEDLLLLNIVTDIRARCRTRVHAFNTIPDMYNGRYKGNVNVGQCCNPALDRRGDWVFLLDPLEKGNTTVGVNGSIITDDPLLLDKFYQSIERHE